MWSLNNGQSKINQKGTKVMKLINYTIILIMVLLCLPFTTINGQGARYTGEYKTSPKLQYVGKSNFVIEGLDFSEVDGDVIGLYNCENVTIKNNRFRNSNKRGIYLFNCKNVTIIDNSFDHVHTALTASTSQGVKFEYNDVYNIGGPLSESNDTNNGFVAHFIQVTGAGNSISYNAAENIYGESSPGDLINVNQSHGTAQSPIIVKGNWFRGGGPSHSGGGILIGDLGGSYQIAEDNILVNPGQYGMGIGGGHSMIMRNNKVYSKSEYYTNVGYSIANWSESQSGKSHTITFEGNTVNYANRDGVTGNSWWIAENMKPVAGVETNRYDPNLNASILPEQLVGRARLGLPPTNPGEDRPGNGELEPDENEVPDNDDKPNFELPKINNHPSITIYLDLNNRVCINVQSRQSSAMVVVADINGNILYNQPLNRYHTVLPNENVPGTYYVYVKNADREHLKTITLR
jgi:parallel beta-helix repeat protein